MKIIDPIERYEYPEEWVENVPDTIIDELNTKNNTGYKTVYDAIASGLYIICPNGRLLRRGLTTGTTASAAVKALSESSNLSYSKKHNHNKDRIDNFIELTVKTPVNIDVKVRARLIDDNTAATKKFSGDHAFDITSNMDIIARKIGGAGEDGKTGKTVLKGYGIDTISRSAMDQLLNNMGEIVVEIEIPDGIKKGAEIGRDGISLLGTTGFVEPWCDRLIDMKSNLAKEYERVAIVTGRKGWRWAYDNTEYQPIVFGIHIDEGLQACTGEISLVGMPSLIGRWAGIDFNDKKGDIEREELVKQIYFKAKKISKNLKSVHIIFKDRVISYG